MKKKDYLYLITSIKNVEEGAAKYQFVKEVISLDRQLSSPDEFVKFELNFCKIKEYMSIIAMTLLCVNKVKKEKKNEKNNKEQ